MSKRKLILTILAGLAAIVGIATVIAYFIVKPDKPWLAFYIACCGGVIVVNFLISIFFVNKNFRDRR